MLKKIIDNLGSHKLRKDMQRFANTAAQGNEQEVAELVAATMLARAYVEELPAVGKYFPNGLYNGKASAESIQALKAAGYEAQLSGLQSSLMKSGSPNLEAVSTGVSVWLYSWHALVNSDLRAEGESLWKAMEPGFALARKLLRPIAATVKRDAEQLFFVPSGLLSGYEAMSSASVVEATRTHDTVEQSGSEKIAAIM